MAVSECLRVRETDFYRAGIMKTRAQISLIRQCARGLCWKIVMLQRNK
jgi:hypothetical protein